MPACWALAIQSKSCVPVLCTVFDNVRSNVPHMLLDDVFTAKEEIATSVKEELVRAGCACALYIIVCHGQTVLQHTASASEVVAWHMQYALHLLHL